MKIMSKYKLTSVSVPSISSSMHLLTCPSDYRFLGLSFFMSTYLLDTLAGEGEIEQKGTQTEEN